METKSSSPGLGVKLIALLLILGGIFGVIVGLYQEWQTLTNSGIRAAALTGLFVLLFGWSTWVGFELWHGELWAFKWGKVVLAAQIPIFVVPGFAFDVSLPACVSILPSASNPRICAGAIWHPASTS